MKKTSMLDIKRIVVLPDIHTPNEHKPSIEAILKFLVHFKPHKLIQLGDFCDFDALSSFDPAHKHQIVMLEDELKMANILLDRIDKAVGKKCERTMIGGNHENRYHKAAARHLFVPDRISRSMISWKESWADEYRLKERGWKWVEYGQWLHEGKLILTHGWASGTSSPSDIAKRFPGRNVLFGHTHQHLVSGFMDENGLPIEIESIGTLSNFDLHYLNGKPPYNWARGFTYIYMNQEGSFTKNFVHVVDGKFIFNGKQF